MNDDLISRKALKKVITANHYLLSAKHNSTDYGMFTTGIIDAIDNAPTVDTTFKEVVAYECGQKSVERPHGEWIPVSERLPEGKIDPMTKDFELVLCSTVWNVVRIYTFGKPIGHDKAHFWNGGGVMDDYVIAWMPLPESYKETNNDSL